MNIHRAVSLWITPVEKTVENVENCELSTGISPPCPGTASCGKLCIRCCIRLGEKKKNRVTSPWGICGPQTEKWGKSLQSVKNEGGELLQIVIN